MTRFHQTYDLGDGELTIDLSYPKPPPPEAYAVLRDLAADVQKRANSLRDCLGDE